MDDALGAVVVVVPVRNEEKLLGLCLDHVRLAMEQLHRARPQITVSLTVVLDQCQDSSALVAASHAARDKRITVISVDFGSVGSSRASGIENALAALSSCVPPDRSLHETWIACTDADTQVPAHWLTRAVELAESGHDAVTGTVEPDRNELGETLFAAWQREHRSHEGHNHVHGANLGFRASEYRAVGGFPPVPVDEDVLLVDRLRAHGARILATGQLHAITSGRIQGRVGTGFAAYLHSLDTGTSTQTGRPNS